MAISAILFNNNAEIATSSPPPVGGGTPRDDDPDVLQQALKGGPPQKEIHFLGRSTAANRRRVGGPDLGQGFDLFVICRPL